MASPRVCCIELGNRATAQAVEGRTRVERQDTALLEGACRDSIVICEMCSIEQIVVEKASFHGFIEVDEVLRSLIAIPLIG